MDDSFFRIINHDEIHGYHKKLEGVKCVKYEGGLEEKMIR
jgi:hypothetical protein